MFDGKIAALLNSDMENDENSASVTFFFVERMF